MEVRARDPTGTTYLCDHLPLGDPFPLPSKVPLVMCVDGHNSIGMLNNNDIPIAAQMITIDDFAFLDGANRSPRAGRNVNPIMEGPPPRAEF